MYPWMKSDKARLNVRFYFDELYLTSKNKTNGYETEGEV